VLTDDEARRVAFNIALLPELLAQATLHAAPRAGRMS
jgi:hypothetical protein